MAKVPRARPPLGQRSSPRRRRPQREGGGGACPPVTWWPSAEAASDPGDRWRGNARLLKAARMRLKHLGSNAGGSAAGSGGGCSSGGGGGGGSRGAGSAPVDPVQAEAPTGAVPGLPSPAVVGEGEKVSAPRPPDRGGPSTTEPPRSARRSGDGRFVGLGASDPNAGGGYPTS